MLILVKPFGRCLFASSDFPAENPRTQTRNVPYTKPLGIIMTNIQILIIFLFSIGVSAQNISEINSDLKLSDSLNDTEIRIYQGGGITNYSSLFRMFKDQSEKWTAEFYEHYAKVNGQTELQAKKQILESENNMEFVFKNLIRSHILDLPSLNEIQWKLNTRGNVEKVITKLREKTIEEYEFINNQISILDGESFKVQAKGWKRNNEFEFSNPDSYLKHYPEIDELIYIDEILSTVRNEFGIWKK